MTSDELNKRYFEWMNQLVCNEKRRSSYLKLLNYLNCIDFTYTIPKDGNRAEDGIDLRYRFGYEYHYEDSMIDTYLNNRPCSVLEMIIALSMRCEEHIMDDPDIGNRMGQWFWSMINNLRLGHMDDMNFDRIYIYNVVSKFLNREYARNGEGGLFTVKNYKYDLRTAEIWYQMCWYLNDILGE